MLIYECNYDCGNGTNVITKTNGHNERKTPCQLVIP